jgi:hypothetical protein
VQVDAALDGMALAVDVLVEPRWSATARSPFEPVGFLITLDRDGRGDTAPAQVGPVGSRRVGLVGQDPIRARPRTTRPPPGHTDAFQHGDELRAVPALTSGDHQRQRFASLLSGQMHLRGPSTTRAPQPVIDGFDDGGVDTGWLDLTVRVSPGTRGVLMSPHDRGVHRHVPTDHLRRVPELQQPNQDLSPDTVALPAPKQPVDRLPGPVPFGHIPPRGPRRMRQRTPSINCRLVHFGSRPRPLVAGRSGASTSHCASVRS